MVAEKRVYEHEKEKEGGVCRGTVNQPKRNETKGVFRSSSELSSELFWSCVDYLPVLLTRFAFVKSTLLGLSSFEKNLSPGRVEGFPLAAPGDR